MAQIDAETTTLLCKWCGKAVAYQPRRSNPWKHTGTFSVMCRDEDGHMLKPYHRAEPTRWDT